MATRYYFPSSGAAAVSPAFSATWESTALADRLAAVTARISSAMTDKAGDTVVNAGFSAVGQFDSLVRQYVSAPIGAQTFFGTVKGQFRAFEVATSNDIRANIRIYVVSNDGGTVRGVLCEVDETAGANPAGEFNTALRNAKFPWTSISPVTVGAIAASNTDRIVFEVGAWINGGTASGKATINFGDNSATDLPEDATTTAANNPWVEFSMTIAAASAAVSDNPGLFDRRTPRRRTLQRM